MTFVCKAPAESSFMTLDVMQPISPTQCFATAGPFDHGLDSIVHNVSTSLHVLKTSRGASVMLRLFWKVEVLIASLGVYYYFVGDECEGRSIR
jgi:hypothetical protein